MLLFAAAASAAVRGGDAHHMLPACQKRGVAAVEFILFVLIDEALSAKHSTRETIMIHDMQICMLEFIALRRRRPSFALATPECARASRGSE